MHRLQPVVQSPSNDKGFMDKAGWQLIVALATIVAGIIAAIILGTTHVVGFDWVVAILVGIMFCVMVYCIWYNFRSRKQLQEQYNRDIASIKNDSFAFRNNMSQIFAEDTQRWSNWSGSFSQQVDKEHKERTERLEKRLMEAIHDAEIRLDGSIKGAQSIFSSSVKSYDSAVDSYKQQLIQTWNRMTALEEQMKALEEQLKKEPVPEIEEEA